MESLTIRACLISVVVVAAACGGRGVREASAPVADGISIAVYAGAEHGYAFVEDRRDIEVIDGAVVIDRIEPDAPLQSLVIEPLGRESIRIGACTRERIDDSAAALAAFADARAKRPQRVIVVHPVHDPQPARFHLEDTRRFEPAVPAGAGVLSPLVRCEVRARPGTHRVRVTHVADALAFQTRHELTMTAADQATIATRFAVTTPAWGTKATVTLFEGLPGDEAPPRALVRGVVVLDGSQALLTTAPRTLGARLRSVYDGAKLDDTAKPDDIVWGKDSRHQVWVWLEIADPTKQLSRGPVMAHVDGAGGLRDVLVTAPLERTGELVRWPLWVDDGLRGSRQRTIDRADGVTITDRVQLGVSNLGDQPREVWIEERLRPAKRRTLAQSWGGKPTFAKHLARRRLVIAPGATERLGFTIVYEF